MNDDLYEQLHARGIKARSGVPGAQCTTFAIGGALSLLIEPETPQQLSEALMLLHSSGSSYRVLGNGSNLLIQDDGIRLPVVRLGKGFRFCRALGEGRFEVGGSTSLLTLSRDLSAQGYSGLEFAGGIPASVGGAVQMNAGAHRGEMSDRIMSVSILQGDGREVLLRPRDLAFSYRHSGIPADAIIIGAELQLVDSDPATTSSLRAKYLAERKARQPLSMPSAGSVFRNPGPDLSAGFVIEKAGLKGQAAGGAEISQMHANWIVNPKREARAADVSELIALCQRRALESQNVSLVPEVVRWD